MDAEQVWRKMSPVEDYTRETFENWAGKQFSIGQNKAWRILKALLQMGKVQLIEEKRSGTNDLKKYRKKS